MLLLCLTGLSEAIYALTCFCSSKTLPALSIIEMAPYAFDVSMNCWGFLTCSTELFLLKMGYYY